MHTHSTVRHSCAYTSCDIELILKYIATTYRRNFKSTDALGCLAFSDCNTITDHMRSCDPLKRLKLIMCLTVETLIAVDSDL